MIVTYIFLFVFLCLYKIYLYYKADNILPMLAPIFLLLGGMLVVWVMIPSMRDNDKNTQNKSNG